jgi:hypothetical protein
LIILREFIEIMSNRNRLVFSPSNPLLKTFLSSKKLQT